MFLSLHFTVVNCTSQTEEVFNRILSGHEVGEINEIFGVEWESMG